MNISHQLVVNFKKTYSMPMSASNLPFINPTEKFEVLQIIKSLKLGKASGPSVSLLTFLI